MITTSLIFDAKTTHKNKLNKYKKIFIKLNKQNPN